MTRRGWWAGGAAIVLQVLCCRSAAADGPCLYIHALDALEMTPLKGMEEIFLKAGDLYNVDPRLIYAIGQQETHLGRDPRAAPCTQHHNAWGYNGCQELGSWAKSIQFEAAYLRSKYLNANLTTIDAIMPKYCCGGDCPSHPECASWAPNVKSIYSRVAYGNPYGPLSFGWSCCGDCDGDASVDVGELITEANVALDFFPFQACPRGEVAPDGRITIDEIIAAVNEALDGCVAR